VIAAVEAILTDHVTHAFCNVRPPGHHASTSAAAGFCIFNNVAIGVYHYLTQRPTDKVAIVDWDVHHGDGTEAIVKAKSHPNVFFFSLYNSEIYPGNVGPSDREKRIENIPLTSSKKYRAHFKANVLGQLKLIQPDLIFISCGFDAHKLDPLGGFDLTGDDYAWMTKKLLQVTPHIISVLEGGYNFKALTESTQAHLAELKHAVEVATIAREVAQVSV
jgi:acetoin utilization deacetylase AcuC-like enzyme